MSNTNINSELLSSDSRGKKHIPMAVFTVVIIHIVLFLILLIAAGCRAKSRARSHSEIPEMVQNKEGFPAASAPVEPSLPDPLSRAASSVVATEPMIEEPAAPGPRRTEQRALPSGSRAEAVEKADEPVRTYVVRAGDTIGKIAKDHGTTVRAVREENQIKGDLIRVGQKLRVRLPRDANRNLATL